MTTILTPPASSAMRVVEGRILKKKKRQEVIVLSIKEDNQQQETKVVISDKNHPSLAFCVLEAIVRVEGTLIIPQEEGEERNLNKDQVRILAHVVDLVHCAPTPQAVDYVMEGILNDRFPEWTLPLSLDEVQEISKLEFRQRRTAVAKVVRMIRGEATERDPRQRRPHTKRSDLELLDRIEAQQQEATTIRTIIQMETPGQESLSSLPSVSLLNLPLKDKRDVISRGRTRMEYCTQKKQPQVQWMTRRVKDLVRTPRHIVDVGGGRGDMAVGMARDFVDSIITVVDKNEASLMAGKEHALKVMGGNDTSVKKEQEQQINFVHADFYDFTENPEAYLSTSSDDNHVISSSSATPPIDLVVALHACGDLSDLAMAFATRLDIPFVVCPCCYTKRFLHEQHHYLPKWVTQSNWTTEEFQVMARLAELNERPHVSKRAIQIINSMRLDSFEGDAEKNDSDAPWVLYLEEYESKSSLRNLVLIRDR